ncbi:MAG: hypothetical protein GY950_05135, partial [bacterium]|nr:hypothetical protein [bacterium]
MKNLKKGILVLLVVLGVSFGVFAADVHVVISEKPIMVRDGETGQQYDKVKGYCTVNWKAGLNYGFCYAYGAVEKGPVYEFLLVSVKSTGAGEIKG